MLSANRNVTFIASSSSFDISLCRYMFRLSQYNFPSLYTSVYNLSQSPLNCDIKCVFILLQNFFSITFRKYLNLLNCLYVRACSVLFWWVHFELRRSTGKKWRKLHKSSFIMCTLCPIVFEGQHTTAMQYLPSLVSKAGPTYDRHSFPHYLPTDTAIDITIKPRLY